MSANTATLLGFAIGLAGTCIVLQIETLVRLAPKNPLMEATRKITAARDRTMVEAAVLDLAERSATALCHRQDLVTQETHAILKEAQRAVREAATGRIRRPALSVDLLLRQIGTTRQSVRATTDDRDTTWWLSERGQQFFEANALAIQQRKVRVERIFMSDGSSDIQQIIARHKEIDVQCYLLDTTDVRRDQVVNLTIFDRRAVHRDEHNNDGSTKNQLYSVSRDDIEEAERVFQHLRGMAVRV